MTYPHRRHERDARKYQAIVSHSPSHTAKGHSFPPATCVLCLHMHNSTSKRTRHPRKLDVPAKLSSSSHHSRCCCDLGLARSSSSAHSLWQLFGTSHTRHASIHPSIHWPTRPPASARGGLIERLIVVLHVQTRENDHGILRCIW